MGEFCLSSKIYNIWQLHNKYWYSLNVRQLEEINLDVYECSQEALKMTNSTAVQHSDPMT